MEANGVPDEPLREYAVMIAPNCAKTTKEIHTNRGDLVELNKNQYLQCQKCLYSCTFARMSKHPFICCEDYICEKCGVPFDNAFSLKKHQATSITCKKLVLDKSTKLLRCSECGRTGPTIYFRRMSHHVARHDRYRKVIESQGSVQCQVTFIGDEMESVLINRMLPPENQSGPKVIKRFSSTYNDEFLRIFTLMRRRIRKMTEGGQAEQVLQEGPQESESDTELDSEMDIEKAVAGPSTGAIRKVEAPTTLDAREPPPQQEGGQPKQVLQEGAAQESDTATPLDGREPPPQQEGVIDLNELLKMDWLISENGEILCVPGPPDMDMEESPLETAAEAAAGPSTGAIRKVEAPTTLDGREPPPQQEGGQPKQVLQESDTQEDGRQEDGLETAAEAAAGPSTGAIRKVEAPTTLDGREPPPQQEGGQPKQVLQESDTQEDGRQEDGLETAAEAAAGPSTGAIRKVEAPTTLDGREPPPQQEGGQPKQVLQESDTQEDGRQEDGLETAAEAAAGPSTGAIRKVEAPTTLDGREPPPQQEGGQPKQVLQESDTQEDGRQEDGLETAAEAAAGPSTGAIRKVEAPTTLDGREPPPQQEGGQPKQVLQESDTQEDGRQEDGLETAAEAAAGPSTGAIRKVEAPTTLDGREPPPQQEGGQPKQVLQESDTQEDGRQEDGLETAAEAAAGPSTGAIRKVEAPTTLDGREPPPQQEGGQPKQVLQESDTQEDGRQEDGLETAAEAAAGPSTGAIRKVEPKPPDGSSQILQRVDYKKARKQQTAAVSSCRRRNSIGGISSSSDQLSRSGCRLKAPTAKSRTGQPKVPTTAPAAQGSDTATPLDGREPPPQQEGGQPKQVLQEGPLSTAQESDTQEDGLETAAEAVAGPFTGAIPQEDGQPEQDEPAVKVRRFTSGEINAMFELRSDTFHCKKCPAKYTRKQRLVAHYKQKHLGIVKLFQCAICGKKIETKDVYVKHLKSHNPRSYKCEPCNQTFARIYELQRHLQTAKCRQSCKEK